MSDDKSPRAQPKLLIQAKGIAKIAAGVGLYGSLFTPTPLTPVSYAIVGGGISAAVLSTVPFAVSKVVKYAASQTKNHFLKTRLENFGEDLYNISSGMSKIGRSYFTLPLAITIAGAQDVITGVRDKETLDKRFTKILNSGLDNLRKVGAGRHTNTQAVINHQSRNDISPKQQDKHIQNGHIQNGHLDQVVATPNKDNFTKQILTMREENNHKGNNQR